jgi:hypothetical protein
MGDHRHGSSHSTATGTHRREKLARRAAALHRTQRRLRQVDTATALLLTAMPTTPFTPSTG